MEMHGKRLTTPPRRCHPLSSFIRYPRKLEMLKLTRGGCYKLPVEGSKLLCKLGDLFNFNQTEGENFCVSFIPSGRPRRTTPSFATCCHPSNMYTIVLCRSVCVLCWSLEAFKASTWMMIWFPTFIFYFFCVRLLLNTQRPRKHRRIKTQLLFKARFNCAAPAAADEMKFTMYSAHPCPHAKFMRLATYPRLEIINPTVFSSASWIYRLVAPTSLLVRMMRINKNIIQRCAAPAAAAGKK